MMTYPPATDPATIARAKANRMRNLRTILLLPIVSIVVPGLGTYNPTYAGQFINSSRKLRKLLEF
jgi:hypothetical protein